MAITMLNKIKVTIKLINDKTATLATYMEMAKLLDQYKGSLRELAKTSGVRKNYGTLLAYKGLLNWPDDLWAKAVDMELSFREVNYLTHLLAKEDKAFKSKAIAFVADTLSEYKKYKAAYIKQKKKNSSEASESEEEAPLYRFISTAAAQFRADNPDSYSPRVKAYIERRKFMNAGDALEKTKELIADLPGDMAPVTNIIDVAVKKIKRATPKKRKPVKKRAKRELNQHYRSDWKLGWGQE